MLLEVGGLKNNVGKNYSKPLIFYYMTGEKVSFGNISIPGSSLNTTSPGNRDRNSFFSILKFYLHEFNQGLSVQIYEELMRKASQMEGVRK